MKLQIADDAGEIYEYDFDQDDVTIGRLPENTIRLTDRNISRRHLRLVSEEGETFVEDAGSSFGVRLNGNRIGGRTRLLPGDRLEFGDYVVRLTPLESDVTAEIQMEEDSTQGALIPGGVQGHLVLMNGPDEGAAFPLDRTFMMLGSADHNAIVLSGMGVAEVHAQLRWDGEGFEIEEMNGDVVVNSLLVESAYLSTDDRIEIGELKLSLRLTPKEAPAELVETRPSTEWDPQGSPTIQGDLDMIGGGEDTAKWWLVPLLLLGVVGTIIVMVTYHKEPRLTALQKQVTRVVDPRVGGEEDPGYREASDPAGGRNVEIVEKGPNSLILMKADAKEAMINRDWDNAITLFQSILERDPEDEDSRLKLAQSEMEERRRDLVNDLEEFIAKADYIQAWERTQKSDVSVTEESVYYQQFVKHRATVEEQTLKLLVQYGREALTQGNWKAAEKLARDAMGIQARSKDAREILKEARDMKSKSGKGAPRKGSEISRTVNEVAPWEEVYNEGYRAKRSGNNALAITKFKESIGLKNNAKSNKQLGILYAVQGDSKKAIQYYKEYLRLSPDAKDAAMVKTVIGKLSGTL